MVKVLNKRKNVAAIKGRKRRLDGLMSGTAVAVFTIASVVSVQQSYAGIAINNSSAATVNANASVSYLGGYTTSSFNGVAMAGASDCGVFTGSNPASSASVTDLSLVQIYGTDSNATNGLYGLGAQTDATSWGAGGQHTGGGTKGITAYSTANQTVGSFWYTTANATTLTNSESGSIAPAHYTQAHGVNSFAVGCGSRAYGLASTALGMQATSTGVGSSAIGLMAKATGNGSLAMGVQANASAVDTLALGTASVASVDRALAVGAQSSATGVSAVAYGAYATANHANASAFGSGGTGASSGVIASGAGATALGGNATKGAQATGADSVAIAGQSLASGASAVAVGLSATASGASAIALGSGSTASGASSIAIGVGNTVSGAKSGAIGDPTTITGDGSYSLGNDNTIAGANAGIFGNNGNIGSAGLGARIIGNNGSVNVADGFVLGNSASVTAAGGVAIGSNSKASTAAGAIGFDPFTNAASSTTGGAWVATNGAVSVGDGATVTRQITGLASGTADTDAVNVAQLKKLRDYTAQGWNLTAGGKNSTNVGVAGAIDLSAGSTNLLVSKGTDNNNVTFDLAQDINITSVTTGKTKVNTDGVTINSDAGDTKLTATGLSIAGGPSITTTGIDNAGKKATNLADATLSDTSTDAVTGRQLNATNTSVTNLDTRVGTYAARTSAYLGGGADIAGDKAPTYSIQGSNKTNVGDAFGAVDSAITTNKAGIADLKTNALQWNPTLSAFDAGYDTAGTGTKSAQKITNVANATNDADAVNYAQLKSVQAASAWNLSVNGAGKTSVGGGATVDFKAGSSNLSVAKSATGTDLTFDLAKDIAIDSVTTGHAKIDTNGLTIANGPSVTTAGIDAASKKITNVADGTLSASSKDAVNGSQLNATNINVSNLDTKVDTYATRASSYLGGGADIAAGTAPAFAIQGATYNNVNSAFGAVNTTLNTQNSNISALQADALQWNAASSAYDASHGTGTAQKITNVANGTNTSDAVNYGQLSDAISASAWNLSVNGANSTKIGNGTTVDLKAGSSNLTIAKATSGNGITFDVAKNLSLESVTATGAVTAGSFVSGNAKIDTNGLTIANGPSVTTAGIDAASKKITNVADGTLSASSKDAVNGSQLNATNINVSNLDTKVDTYATRASSYLGGGADIAAGTAPAFAIQGTTYNNVNSAFGAVNTTLNTHNSNISALQTDALQWNAASSAYDASHGTGTAQKITNVANGTNTSDAVNYGQLSDAISASAWNLSVNGANSTKIGNGTTVDLKAGSSNLTIAKATSGNGITFDIAKNLSLESVTATGAVTAGSFVSGNAKIDTNGLTIANGPSVTTAGIDAASKKITNVADGTLSASSKDAVNGSQLNATNANVTAVDGRVTALDAKVGSNAANVSTYLGGGADIANGVAPSYSIQGATKNNVGDALSAVDSALTSNKNAISVNKTAINNLQTDALQWNSALSAYDASHGTGTAQKITNVADGTLSTTSTDAVNGKQLNATNTNVTAVGNRVTALDNKVGTYASNVDTYLGGGSSVANGVAPSYSIQGATKNNVGDALTSVDAAITTNKNAITGLQTDALQWSAALSAYDASHGTGTVQKITNVADGALSTTSTDAVNGKQLNATNTNVTAVGNRVTNLDNKVGTYASNVDTYLGGGASVANAVAPSYSIQGATKNNVGDALSSVDAALTTNKNAISANKNAITGLQTDALQWNSASGAYDASHGSGTAQKITNVADGTLSATSTDAVNGKQLNATNANVTAVSNRVTDVDTRLGTAVSNTNKYLGGNTDVAAGTAPSFNIQGNKTDNVTSAFNAVDTVLTGQASSIATLKSDALQWNQNLGAYDASHGSGTAQKISNVAAGTNTNDAVNLGQLNDKIGQTGWNLSANGENTTRIGKDSTVDLKAGSSNLTIAKATGSNDVTFDIARNLNLDSVQAGNVKLDNTGLAITGGPSVTTTGINAGAKKVTNVAQGTASGDAVNFDQLSATNANVTNNTAAIAANKTAITTNTTDIAGLKTNALQWNGTDSFDATRGGAAQKITGVAAGTVSATSTDAVNGSQLNATNTNVTANKTAIAANSADITGLKTNALQWNGTDSFDAKRGGAAQKITGIADGDVSATSTDAVNGKQLNATNTSVTNVANRVTDVDTRLGTAVTNTNKYLGGGADIATGTAPSFNVQGAAKNSVADAFGAVDGALTAHNTAINNNKTSISALQTDALQWNSSLGAYDASHGSGTAQKITNVAAGTNATDAVNVSQLNDKIGSTGWNLTANGANGSKIGNGGTVDLRAGSSNLTVTKTADSNAVAFDVAQDLNLTSVKTGSATLNNDGLTIANGPSVTNAGINAGAKKVTNLADGDVTATSTDAITGRQLNTTNTNVAANTSAIAANKTAITTNTTDIAGLKTNALQWNGTDSFDATRGGAAQKITGVAAGTVSATSTDAVNGSQLNATNTNVTNVQNRVTDVDTRLGTAVSNTNKYFGGNTDVAAGVAPNFKVQGSTYNDVTSALGGVDTSLNNIKNDVASIGSDALKWDATANAFNAQRKDASGTTSKGKITNVGDATLSATSSDAVTGSQLFATNNEVAANQARIANVADKTSLYLGGGADLANNKAPTYNIGGSDFDNVGSALTKVDTTLNGHGASIATLQRDAMQWNDGLSAFSASRNGAAQRITNVANGTEASDAVNKSQLDAAVSNSGWNLSTDGQNSTKVGAGDSVDLKSGNNINVSKTANGRDVTFDLAKDITVDSVTAKDVAATNVTADNIKAGNTSIDTNGLKIAGGPSVTASGIDAASKKVTNVADATLSATSKDAVNASQLFATNSNIDAIAANTSKYLGAGADVKNGTAPSYSVQGGSYDNVGSALGGVDAAFNNVNSQINTINNSALMWNVGEGAYDAARDKGTGTKTNSKITHVQDGTLSADSSDAVTGSQLWKTQQDVNDTSLRLTNIATNTSNYLGGGANVQTGEAPTYNIQGDTYRNVGDAFNGVNTNLTNVQNQIANVNKDALMWDSSISAYNAARADASGNKTARRITGVAEGNVNASSTDAVNGSQLNTTNLAVEGVSDRVNTVAQNTNKYLGGGADVANGVAPSFNVQGTKYNNVGAAFGGVNSSLTDIKDQVASINTDALKWDSDLSAFSAAHDDGTGTKVASKITNVKAGRVATDSTDAVNGSQLFATNTNVATLKTTVNDHAERVSTYLGGGADIIGGTAPTYNVQGQSYRDVGSALGGVNSNLTDIKGQIAGINTDALMWDATLGAFNAGHDNGTGTKVASKITNVKAGDVSATSTDAINGSQLFATNTRITDVTNATSAALGGGADLANGKAPTYQISTIAANNARMFSTGETVTNFDNVGDALSQLNTNVNTVNTKVDAVRDSVTALNSNALLWDEEASAFSAKHTKDGVSSKSKITNIADGSLTAGSSDAVTGGQLYSSNAQIAAFFGGGAAFNNGTWTAPNFVISQIGTNGSSTNANYNNVADAFGGVNSSVNNVNQRVTDVQNQINNMGPDANALRYDEAAGGYNAGAKNNQPNKIVNVADGSVTQGSKDAVNGGQLWDTNQRINNIQTNVNDVVNNSVMYDKDASGNKTNSISLKGADASKPVTINNVADGKIEKGSKQAVNGGQLYDYTKEQTQITLNESKAYTDRRVDNIVQSSVEQANYYTDTKFNQLNSSITSARNEARRAAAIGLAAASLRFDNTPGKLSVAAGSGFWKSQGAFAFGAGYTSETGKVRSNITATAAGGDWGVGAGVSITLN